MRKSGNKVRITAQLIKAADGYHLWSETYDRTLDDIFVVQDDIAGEVVKALKLTLLGPSTVPRSNPVDSEAYNLALQGRFFYDRRSRKNLERAVEYFRRSLERDPGYAPSWAGLSLVYAAGRPGQVSAADGFRQARDAAEKALALDPQLVHAHLAMGWIQASYDWDWAAADASIIRVLSSNPAAPRSQHAGVQALILGAGMKRSTWRTRPSSAIRCGPTPTATSATCSWQSSATRRPRLRIARPSSSIATAPSGTRRSGSLSSYRARPTPPCRRLNRKRTRSIDSLGYRSHITHSAGGASPTRRW